MPYTNAEILSGILVVVTLMLLFCWYYKRNSEGLKNYPGLYLKGRNGYVPKPNYGTFLKRDGYTPLGMNINTRGAMTRNPEFERSGMSDRNKSLNELVTKATPASDASSTPHNCDTELMWWSDGSIPLDIFSRDGGVNQSVQLSDKDSDSLVKMALGNSSDASTVKRNPSTIGHYFANADYTHPSRELSW